MDNQEPKINILEFLEQTVDASIDVSIRDCLENSPNSEYLMAVYDLLREYGIRGRKGIEFITKLGTIGELMGGNKDG